MNSTLPPEGLREKLRRFYRTSQPYTEHLVREDASYFKRYLSLIDQYGSPADTVLDAGCGTGLSTHLLSQKKRRVVGIDLSELFLREGIQKGPDRNFLLAAADILNLPFQDETFDWVGSYLVVEFLPDVQRGLSEMIRVLRKGGILLIATPNLLSPKWPLLDFIRLLRGGSANPVWCESPRAALATFWRNLTLSLKKSWGVRAEFLYREPDLSSSRVVGRDSDSVYLACPTDLIRFLKREGFQILRRGPSSTILERLFPSLAAAVEIVARKN